MIEFDTWYVLEDGNIGDPLHVAPGADGKLVHKDGRKVKYRPDGVTPWSRGGIDAVAERAKAGADNAANGKKAARESKPEGDGADEQAAPKRGYKTREVKGE